MQLTSSAKAKPCEAQPNIESAIDVSTTWLRKVVERLSIPRHYIAESENNRMVGDWIENQLSNWGYSVSRQGHYGNVVALPPGVDAKSDSLILIGAHYDSVPGTPGADDNGSAVAAMLGCAKAIMENAVDLPICFVAFNREEDGLLGSRDFVQNYASRLAIRETHILEMVGFADHKPGSQRLPSGLPASLTPDAGDFLALVSNRKSNQLVKGMLRCAKTYVPDFSVLGLKVFFGLEKRVKDLGRSDHGPFWDAGIPAIMWTDTSEFRNPNYHQRSDTPDTLDYDFLRSVTQLLIAYVMSNAVSAPR